MDNTTTQAIFSAMNTGKPLKSYIKTILGKVYVTVWDTMVNQPVGLLLSGDPRKHEDSTIIDLWSEQELVFFKRMNQRHLQEGTVIEYVSKAEEEKELPLEACSDEELEKIIKSPFLKLQNILNKTQSLPFVFRIKNMATDLDVSEKIIRAIEARIAELQALEFKSPDSITFEK